MNNLKETEAQVALLLKELSETMNFFPKEIAQIMYAKQLTDTVANIPANTGMDKKKIEEGNQRIRKMMEEGKLKWEYATEAQKKKVAEMEAAIIEINNKIKDLYTATASGTP